MNTITLSMAFIMGFTLSLHCAGMCGPIMLVMPFQLFSGIRKFVALSLYHLGRISVYALLAVILHSFRSLFNPKIQQYVSITLGLGLLIMGIVSFLPNKKLQFKLPFTGLVKKQLGKFIGNPGFNTIFITGALNGLLPCGLVYVALSASLNAGNTIQSALFMLAFGLGTLPILVVITIFSKSSFLKNKLAFLRIKSVKSLVPAIMFVFGCLFILRGLNLGIPYLSPKIEVTQNKIKANCCHKTK